MNKVLIILGLVLTSILGVSQNGQVETLTLSDGIYQENHDNDSIVRIGSALFNVRTNQVIGINFSEDTISKELEEEMMGRWLATDPKYFLYPYASPYNFALNKPIIFIDKDGQVIFDKDGNMVTIKLDENGAIESVTGTTDEALKQIIINTFAQGETGKETIEKLDAKDVYAKIITHEKKLVLDTQIKGLGVVSAEVDGISKGEAAGRKEKKAVPEAQKKYIIHIGNVSGDNTEIIKENFHEHDVYGDFDLETPYGTESKEEMAEDAVEQIKNKTAKKNLVAHVDSYDEIPKEDCELYDNQIAEQEKKSKDIRTQNTLIYETANAEAQFDNLNQKSEEAGISSEATAKKAVIKAYKESNPPVQK